MGTTNPRNLLGSGGTTTTITIPAGSDAGRGDTLEDRSAALVATRALEVAACRDAWLRALGRGYVDVRHLEDVGQAERDRLAAVGLTTACWWWTASGTRSGYGQVKVAGSLRMAHRVSWVALQGRDVPAGHQLDHLCRNRGCVNPAHLEPVTNRENTLRGDHPNAVTRRTGVCARGHAITGANISPSPSKVAAGRRQCRACNNATTAAHHRRRTGWDPAPEDRAAFIAAYADEKAAEYATMGPAAGDLERQADDDRLDLDLEATGVDPGPIHACAGPGICRTTGCAAADPVIADAAAYDWWRAR